MAPTPEALRKFVLERAAELGFDLAGIAPAEQFPHLRDFANWIAAGRSGHMEYLARRVEPDGPFLREDVHHLCPWARSIICCGVIYNTLPPSASAASEPSEEAGGTGRGSIARYAWGDDYHRVLWDLLEDLADRIRAFTAPAIIPELKVTTDTAPLVEREAAVHAGLGWQGKNTCLIHPRKGSYFFLGCLITSLDIAGDTAVADHCGTCTRCIDACPTQALDQPYQMDASRCLAYFNIELRGSIPEPMREPMGSWIFGCDICQDVCPWNRRAPLTTRLQFQPRSGLPAPELEEMASLTETQFQELFVRSAVKRAKYQGFMRNVAVAMGNSGDRRYRPALERLASSSDEVIREHARWGLARMDRSG